MANITADTLNSWVEFDSPFTVDASGNVGDAQETIYVPDVEHDNTHDILIDGMDSHDEWTAFSGGYTGQDRYNGVIMHASEQLSGTLARDILANPGIYVVTTVESPCTPAEPCFPDDPSYCIEHGCDATPAGWTVLRYAGA